MAIMRHKMRNEYCKEQRCSVHVILQTCLVVSKWSSITNAVLEVTVTSVQCSYSILSVSQPLNISITRSTGTVHTSAKPRLTSAAIWRISMRSTVMSVACKGAWLNGGGDCNAVAFQYIPLGSLLLDARK